MADDSKNDHPFWNLHERKIKLFMQFNSDLSAQILNNNIDPNWVMVCLMAIVSFLLIRILNKIDTKLDQHDERLEDHEVRITVIEKGE